MAKVFKRIKLSVLKKFIVLICIFSSTQSFSQNADTAKTEKKEKVITGWNLGALPVVAYDSDLGFQYGILSNLYYYGDGSTYPKYLHSIYGEVSRYTKGSGINMLRFESVKLIPGIRFFSELSYLTDQALDFYGFNGAEAQYNPAFRTVNDTDYISRMYYKHERNFLKIKADFQGKILEKNLYWFAGFEQNNVQISTVNIDKLNKGKSGNDTLPHTDLLYDKYVKWGIIPDELKKGNIVNFTKLGIVYDTRDNEPNPQHGIWDEILLITAPRFLGNGNYSYAKLAITHRQYFTLVKNKLSLAYRLSYQPKIGGTLPFYMLPFVYSTNITRDGLGGAKTIRGVLRNRIVGDDLAYANVEIRWKFVSGILLKQNLYVAIAPFFDVGMVTKSFAYNFSGIPFNENIKYQDEKPHFGYGAGLYFAMNQNFIVSVNYGLSGQKSDGSTGLYIGLSFLF